MPFDRYGRKIVIGWSDHEIEWIRAAGTLALQAREDALWDIASMTGRLYSTVHRKMLSVRQEDRAKAKAFLASVVGHPRRVFVANRRPADVPPQA